MKKIAILLLCPALPLAAQDYKIAVVGLGHAHVWGHLERVLKGGIARLVGVAESEPSLAGEARKRGVPDKLIYADYRKMLDETRPDFVWAFNETYRHAEVVETCAPRKIHVMVEKPLAATFQEALAIQRAARKHGIHVMTNYGSTWQPGYYAAKAAGEAGSVGAVWRVRGVTGHGGPGDPRTSYFVSWLADPVKNGGGALVDFGCYNAVFALWIKGKPESVYASANHLQPELFPKVEDNATMILNYRDGAAIFEQSWDLPPRAPGGFEIYGRTGSLTILGNRVELRRGRTPEEVKVAPLPAERAEPIAYMANVLRTRGQVDGMSALDINVDVMEVLEAAKASIKTGRAVRLPLKR